MEEGVFLDFLARQKISTELRKMSLEERSKNIKTELKPIFPDFQAARYPPTFFVHGEEDSLGMHLFDWQCRSDFFSSSARGFDRYFQSAKSSWHSDRVATHQGSGAYDEMDKEYKWQRMGGEHFFFQLKFC